MARLHIVYREDKFDDRILMLTARFMRENPWRRRKDRQRLYEVWLHGACVLYGLPHVTLVVAPQPGEVGRYIPAQKPGDEWQATIALHRYSLISLFHQFRHHMQANTNRAELLNSPKWTEQAMATDAQAWACSLFYVVDPHRFRRQVRKDRVAGVHPEDLLKRRRRA